ncbi:MAG: hypothetical protein EYC68_12765 [Chloroflexota bacterium]|nr:MAG: hypothetical protein EYC68_12765 [Chloroflexota bacterium]
MKQFLLIFITLLFVSACSAPATPATSEATVAPQSQNATAPAPTALPVSNSSADRRAPTLAPSATPTELATPTPRPTNTETSVPTATAPPPASNTRANATATPNLAPAVYVTRIQVDPPAPKSKPAEFLFKVAFLNTVGENVNYPRWRVLIFPKGQAKPVGDPQGASKTIVNGASEQTTEVWSIRVTGACETFTAQPIWEDENGKQTALPQPDGKNIVLEFQVCP